MRQKKISSTMQQKRYERSKLLLNNLKRARAGQVIIFSDEKTFTVNHVRNCQNDRYIRLDEEGDAEMNTKFISSTKHLASVMMLGVVASNGAVCPPVWFGTGYRLTAANYINMLATIIKPWADKVVGKNN